MMHSTGYMDMAYSLRAINQKSIYLNYFTILDSMDRVIYIFYALHGAYLEKFNRMVDSGMIDIQWLQKHGEIVKSDYGTPSQEVLDYMVDHFNFNVDVLHDPHAPPTLVRLPVGVL